jgi:exopolysaccharide biosynthesis polyprenyl glycosylphosphotransferase
VFAHQRKRVQLLFAATDALFTALAFVAAYETRSHMHLRWEFYLLPRTFGLLLIYCVVIWVALGIWTKLPENLDSANPYLVLGLTLRQCVLGTAAVVSFEYGLRMDLSRIFLAFLFAYDLILLTVFHLNAWQLVSAFQRGFGEPYRVVVVGPPEESERYGEQLVEGASFRVELVKVIPEDSCAALLPRFLEQHVVDEIIFRVDSQKLAALEEVLLLCDEEGVRTRVALDFFPHVNSQVSLERVGAAQLLTFSAAPDDGFRLLLKRCFDLVVALAALMLLWPLMLLIAVLIRLTSPGPVIFRQTRCGLNGRRFTFFKFRSMVPNAEALKAELAHLNERQTAFKIADDPRLTPVGRWLRKFSLDELPQLFNVLKGEMSLVGPRPPLPSEVENYLRWQRRRLRMRPGLTCLWAVKGRDHLDFETWMRMDMEYIDSWSLSLDLTILLRSIPYVLTGRGAH